MDNVLNRLIRDVTESLPDSSPREIAEAVLDKVESEVLTQYMLDLVTDRVVDLLRKDRNEAIGQSKNRSSKLERRRDWWAKTLHTRVAVGGVWKQLGDCTVDDLREVISERRQLIDRVQAQIENYSYLIDQMRKYNVNVVSDLSAEQVNL